MNKKLQVFVSSTYTDLIEERQAAVEAILDAGHIPAGMELFKAGNESQLQTIYKWIDESDVYILILGGRYGSIESKSGKSYTQLEYEYALTQNIPVFSIILSEAFLATKINLIGLPNVMEQENADKYNSFKKLVMSKMSKIVSDSKDIKIAIQPTLSTYISQYTLTGWIRDTTKCFANSDELDSYIVKRISSAEKCIYDLSWKDYYYNSAGRPNYNAYIKSQYAFLENITKAIEKGIFFKEIFTFPCNKKERMDKMQKLINYDNYSCGFFCSNQSINCFPKLHIIIIDDIEVIFANYDYNGNLCSSFDNNIVNILEKYFDECWSLCQKIKDYDGIHQDILNAAIEDFNKK